MSISSTSFKKRHKKGFLKGYTPWNKGIKLSEKILKNMRGKVPWNKGKRLSKEHIKNLVRSHIGKKFPERAGENHYNWKGNKVGYMGLHNWIRKQLGVPRLCFYCKSTKAKRYEWANKSGKYKRDLKDWVRLCVSCHKLDSIKIHKRFKKTT